MSDTTGNTELTIATNGTSHMAMTLGATDVCKLPNNIPAPFPNWIQVQGMLHDGTTVTFIANQPVWIQHSYLGPPSDPAHAGINKGVVSGTYRDIARATGWSKDVKMEGEFVVRTNDPTTQNKANTTGKVFGPHNNEVVETKNTYESKHCSLYKFDGFCGHGRSIGKPPGQKGNEEDNYLEILEADTVDFTSWRKDIVTEAIDPTCDLGIHTSWVVRATGGDFTKGDAGPDTPKHEKYYLLGGSFTGVEGEIKAPESSGIELKPPKSKSKIVDTFTKNGTEIAKLLKLWDAALHPRVATVEATSCSGKKTATIKIRPKDKVKVNFIDHEFQNRCVKWRKLGETVANIGKKFGIEAELKFLEKAKLDFSLEYKELNADLPEREFFGFKVGAVYKVECRQAWALEGSADPVLGLHFKKTFSIFDFCRILGGPAGFGAALLADVLGIEASVELAADIEVPMSVSANWDEYNNVRASGSVQAKADFKITITIGGGGYEVKVTGYVEGKVGVDNFCPRPAQQIALGADVKASLQFGIKGHVMKKGTVSSTEMKVPIKYEPDSWKWEWKGEWAICKTPGPIPDSGTNFGLSNDPPEEVPNDPMPMYAFGA